MGCKSCNKNKKINKRTVDLLSDSSPVNFELLGVNITKIVSTDRKTYRINSPLTKIRPPIGWGVRYSINSVVYSTESVEISDIVKEIKEKYEINGINLTSLNIWYNLNIVWLSRVPKKFQIISAEGLSSIGVLLNDPFIWYSKNWDFLETIVNSESFNLVKFNELGLKKLYSMASDPVTGCDTCFDEITKTKPFDITSQKLAKEWFKDIKNKIVKHD